MTGRRIERRPGRQFQAAQEVLLDELDAVLDAPFFIGFLHAAGADFEAVMVGEVQVTRVELGRLAQWMTQDGRLTVVDHDAFGQARKKLESVLVTTEEVLLALTQGELQIHQAAVAQDRDKEGQPASGRADRNEPPTAPIHLHALARTEAQRQESMDRFGAEQPDIFTHDGVTHLHAFFPELLQNLLSAKVVLFQPPFNAKLVGIQFAGTVGTFVLVIRVTQPVADGFLVQLEFVRDLTGGEFLVLVERTDLAIGGIIDHAPPPTIRRRISATGRVWPERAAGSATPPASKGNSSEST